MSRSLSHFALCCIASILAFQFMTNGLATAQTSICDPSGILCQECNELEIGGGLVGSAVVSYEGDETTMWYIITEFTPTMSFDSTTGIYTVNWTIKGEDNLSDSYDPTTATYYMDISGSMADLGLSGYTPASMTGPLDDCTLTWSSGLNEYEFSGGFTTSKMPQTVSFEFEGGGTLNLFFAPICPGGGPGPVTNIPPTPPEPCQGNGGGDGEGPDGGGPEDDSEGGCDDESCENANSGSGSQPGKSAVCPIPEMMTFGAREDYSAATNDDLGGSGCTSCGGNDAINAAQNRMAFEVKRRLTPQELTHHSSFGLGWFDETDYGLDIHTPTDGQPHTIIFFDPQTERVHEMTDGDVGGGNEDGTYENVDGAEFFTGFELDGGETDPTNISSIHTTGTNTLYGNLTRRNGWVYRFQIVDLTPFETDPTTPEVVFPGGRLVAITSPEGFTKTFTYKTHDSVDVIASPYLQFQIDTVEDSYGNTATYTYETDPRGGRYVVSKITVDTDDSDGNNDDEDVILRYEYDPTTDRLAKVERGPVGNATVLSRYTYTNDSVGDNIAWEETTADCPQENDTAILSDDMTVFEGELVSQFAGRLLGRKDGAGFQYMTVYRGNASGGSGENVFRIEYRGNLMDWSPGLYFKRYTGYKTNGAGGFDGFSLDPAESQYARNVYNGTPAVQEENAMLAQPDACIDDTGYQTTLSYDSNGNLTLIEHPSPSPSSSTSYEKYEYNSRNQIIMYRDREGYATLYDYDDSPSGATAGKLLRISRGMKDTETDSALSGYSTVSAEPESTMEVFEYYTAGAKAGLLKASALTDYAAPADPNDPAEAVPPLNIKTEYDYDSNNRLSTVTKPKPNGVTSNPVVTYQWVNGRLDKIIDESGVDTTEFDYDALDRLVKTTYPDGSTEEMWYRDDKNRVYRKDRNNIVSFTERDNVGRISIVATAYATDTDGDLSNDVWDTEQFDPDVRVSGTGISTYTTYSYYPGKLQPFKATTNSRETRYEYDYRDRLVKTTRRIGVAATDVRETENEYLDNRLFRTVESFKKGSEEFSKQTYRGYAADGTTVKIVECRLGTESYADNAAVMGATRPTNLDLATNNLRIIERITDMRGASHQVINERNVITDYDVDAHGRITQMDENVVTGTTQNYIETTTAQYDFRGDVLNTTDPLGSTTVMTYDDAGNRMTRVLASGESYAMSYSYEYDVKGRMSKETLPSGGINEYFYSDCCGRQRGFKNAENERRVTVMNSGGQVVYEAAVADTYDLGAGTYTSVPSADRRNERTRAYDDAGRLQFQTLWRQAIGSSWTTSSGGTAPVARDTTASQGVTTQYAYINKLVTGSATLSKVTADRLQTASTTDTFEIDLGNALTQLQNEGLSLVATRPGSAQIVVSPDEKVYSYSISDSLGRTVMTGQSYGPSTTDGTPDQLINWQVMKYDESDTEQGFPVEVVSTVNFDGYETKSLVDAFGWRLASQQIETSPSRTNETLTEYDISGNPLKVTVENSSSASPDKVVSYTYDELGRQTKMTTVMPVANLETETAYFDHDGGATTRPGLVKQTIDANDNEINFQDSDYDVLGRLLNVRDRIDDTLTSGSNMSVRTYDTEGNMDTLTDAQGQITTYEYDLLGRKTKTMYPDGKEEIMERDDVGRMETVLKLGGSVDHNDLESQANLDDGLQREYQYAYSGVVDEMTFTNNRIAGSAKKHIFEYDNFLRRTSSENELSNVKRTFTYNDRGQMKTEVLDYDTSKTNPLFTTEYDYDLHGRLDEITFPSSGHVLTYSYTDRGQLKTVDWSNLTGTLETRSYDPSGQLTDIDRDQFDEVRAYDEAGRLLSIDNQKTGAIPDDQIGKLTYDYDSNGNKQAESWSDGPSAMSNWDFTTIVGSDSGYDEEDRLTQFVRTGTGSTEADANVTLDRSAPSGANGTIGNIASSSGWTGTNNSQLNGTRTYSDIYELESVGSSLTQSYNLDGQVETMHNGNDLQWDASGRLIEVDNQADVYQYGYDADGRRVWKKKDGDSTFTVYCYGGPNVISELTITSGTPNDTVELDKEYVYGTTIDELLMVDLPVTVSRTQSAQRGVTRNQQWSIMSVYNVISGSIIGRFNYDIFGKRFVVNANGTFGDQTEDFDVPYGYTSRRLDAESELMYFRARYYDPTTGEFVSQDRLEYVDGMSLYRGYFVASGIDPTGLDFLGPDVIPFEPPPVDTPTHQCIECGCRATNGSTLTVQVFCPISDNYDACCGRTCPGGHFDISWPFFKGPIYKAKPVYDGKGHWSYCTKSKGPTRVLPGGLDDCLKGCKRDLEDCLRDVYPDPMENLPRPTPGTDAIPPWADVAAELGKIGVDKVKERACRDIARGCRDNCYYNTRCRQQLFPG